MSFTVEATPLVSASAADAPSIRKTNGIRFVVGVILGAMRLGAVEIALIAPAHVLLMGDFFKMSWSMLVGDRFDASLVSAYVI